MNEVEQWMLEENHAALSNLVQVTVGSLDTFPLLSAPQGGASLLRLRVMPQSDYAISGSNYWVLTLKVRNRQGVEIRTISLDSASLAVLPFDKNKTMIWPSMGRFEERIDEGQTVWLQVDTVGSPTGSFGAQLDFILAGR